MVNFAVLVESTIATNKLVVELHMRRSDQLSASQKHSIKAVAWRASSVDEEQVYPFAILNMGVYSAGMQRIQILY